MWPGDAPQRSEHRRRARTRRRWLLAAALPLLYLQWQAPVQNTATAAGDPATSAAYYRPLLSFLRHQAGAPFRIEIPFTESHAESYYVAPQFALARGWERQLDIRDNPLFYGGHLTAAGYREWLRALAVRFVAVPDAKLDYSAQAELALIDRGPPYLRLVMLAAHWRVYAVRDASPIVQGTASLRALGPDSLTLQADRPGTATVRVRFSPYWALTGVPGCVAPDGDFTRVSLQRAGAAKLVIRFALTRIGSRSPRCS
jgi:hypothetical protein